MSEGHENDERLVCGPHAVLAVLEGTPRRVEGVWLDDRRHDARLKAIAGVAASAGVPCARVARAELDRLSHGVPHQGVVALRHPVAVRGERELAGFLSALDDTQALFLVLDGVQDPHNLGACLRTADAAGVRAVVLPRDRSSGLTAVARRAAAGAAETVDIFQVANLGRALEALKAAGVWLIGLEAEAEASLHATDLRGRIALVLGGEGRGLRRLTREHCDRRVRIPMAGRVESLNVSNAAAVCLFEAVRQRGAITAVTVRLAATNPRREDP